MSPLPNSKSSYLRTAQNCGALLLAGAMALPLVPAQAQTGSPAAESASTTDSASATGSASIAGSLPVDSMPRPGIDQDQHKPATRGELAAALYVQVGAPEMKLPKTSPWPDVKTDDPNFPAYIWANEKGVTSGWSDGKFHADAGISNATVAAFTYRAAGSPAVKGDSMYKDVTPGSAFYREIVWAGQNKVALNTGDSFEPRHMVTRGELVTLVLAFQHRGK